MHYRSKYEPKTRLKLIFHGSCLLTHNVILQVNNLKYQCSANGKLLTTNAVPLPLVKRGALTWMSVFRKKNPWHRNGNDRYGVFLNAVASPHTAPSLPKFRKPYLDSAEKTRIDEA